jgi:predicted amidohydrolase YtcJ
MDTLLLNGNVLTMEGGRRESAIGFRNGRIARVGESNDLRAETTFGTKIVDLGGRTVVPGFTDAHAHVWKIGHLLTSMLDLRNIPSLPALADAIRARDAVLPQGRWLLGRGFNEIALAEKRKPSRYDLDRAAPHRPVVLTRTCGHIYAANSVALNLAGIGPGTETPVGGVIERDPSGVPNGILHETAMGLINRAMPPPTPAEHEEMIQAALRHQLSHGITASSDCGVTPELLSVYRDLDRRSALPVRMLVMPLRRVDGRNEPVPLPEQHVSEWLRVDTVKFLADGGLSGGTAALSVPYRHASTQGTLRFEPEELRLLCRESHRAGWRIATHAIGDVAIDLILDIYESLGPHPKGLSHRIEHFGLPSPRQLARAAKMQVISVPQAIFIYSLGGNFLEMLPDEFLPRCYPIRGMLDAGLITALSSDAPVVEDDNPLTGMYAAIARRTKGGTAIAPEQCISVWEALYGYTVAGAAAAGESLLRGTLAPGKFADLAVLSGDPLTAEPEALGDIHVEMTFVSGRQVYSR